MLCVVTPLWQDRPAHENLEVARLADQLGYPELWVGEMATYDAFAFATAVGLQTSHINLTVGPLAVHVRTPVTMAMGIASVADLTGRGAKLALGTSSAVVVNEWHGGSRVRAAKRLDETAIATSELLAGQKVMFDGSTVRTNGYRLRLPSPGAELTIAAFGPEAVKVAARRSSRLVLNMVTPSAVAKFRELLDAEAAASAGPRPKIAVWLGTAVDATEESHMQMRRSKVAYLAAPGYAEMFTEAGFGEIVNLAKSRPHPRQILESMPPELSATVGLVGDLLTVKARIAEYERAGADEICIVPATAGDPGAKHTLEALRPEV